MNNAKYLIFLFLLFFSSKIYANNPNFEYSGVTQFWNIVKTLEANLEPTAREWDKLFATPGYRVLTNNEFTKDFFIENFSLVFKPNNRNKLDAKLKKGENIHHLKHYIKIRDNKKMMKEQLNKIRREYYNRKAIKKSLEFLPQYSVSNYPPVSFVIFESNGRGSSPIVVDLAATIDWDFLSFISHEYHHWYRNRQLQIKLNKINSSDRDIVTVFSLIEAEGIADMVDKRDWYSKPSKSISNYARKYLQDVRNTPYVIRSIDAALEKISQNPGKVKSLGRKVLQLLPQRGHTTGYYMARVILEKSNKDKLIKCVGNPFEFILLYNDAAKRGGREYPTFSSNSINLIKNLSKKYSK